MQKKSCLNIKVCSVLSPSLMQIKIRDNFIIRIYVQYSLYILCNSLPASFINMYKNKTYIYIYQCIFYAYSFINAFFISLLVAEWQMSPLDARYGILLFMVTLRNIWDHGVFLLFSISNKQKVQKNIQSKQKISSRPISVKPGKSHILLLILYIRLKLNPYPKFQFKYNCHPSLALAPPSREIGCSPPPPTLSNQPTEQETKDQEHKY